MNDEMVELAALKRLDAPERLDEPEVADLEAVKPSDATGREMDNGDVKVNIDARDREVMTSPTKVPRMLKNIESDLKEVAVGPRVRAPPKFYGKLTRLRRLNVQRAEANAGKIAVRQAGANNERAASCMEA